MSTSRDPTRKTQRLTELASSYKGAGTLVGAIEVGLFTAISAGHDRVETIAAKLDLPVETVDRLIIACKSLDLVVQTGGLIRNTASSSITCCSTIRPDR